MKQTYLKIAYNRSHYTSVYYSCRIKMHKINCSNITCNSKNLKECNYSRIRGSSCFSSHFSYHRSNYKTSHNRELYYSLYSNYGKN